MVDYKKRAERRREYYEKIVSDQPFPGVGEHPEGGAPVAQPGRIWAWKHARIRALFAQENCP